MWSLSRSPDQALGYFSMLIPEPIGERIFG
jgi:hypothetical protein